MSQRDINYFEYYLDNYCVYPDAIYHTYRLYEKLSKGTPFEDECPCYIHATDLLKYLKNELK